MLEEKPRRRRAATPRPLPPSLPLSSSLPLSCSLPLPLPLPTPQPVALVGHWDSALLAPVAALNEQMLELLCARARMSEAGALPRLLSGQRELWGGFGSEAQRRLALCPYLLLDAGFAAPQCWDLVPPDRPGVMDGEGPGGYFASRGGVALVRRTFVLAWHLARSNPLAARILLGMSPECVARIAACPLAQLEALAECSPLWVVPRWELQPNVWRQMIQAARAEGLAALLAVQLRGLQLLAAGGEQRLGLVC